MAQLDYFGTWTDTWAILEEEFARGDLRGYWDAGPHDRPDARPFTALTKELKRLLQLRPGLYLYGDFSTHPPLFREQETGIHAGKFYLGDSNGGPLLTFDAANEGIVDGQLKLLVGTLSTQPQYQLSPGHWEKPSPTLKEAYVDLSRRMKKHLTRYQGVWIGPEALQLLQEGKVQLPAGIQPVQAPRKAAGGPSTPPASPLPRAAEPAR